MTTSVQIKRTTVTGCENICKLTGQIYYSYLGIPYAKPPIGDLRFQPPQKPDEMDEEFDASMEGDDCIQMSRSKIGTSGSEDCLYINVYVPKDETEEISPKPVMVFVPGGIFTFMSGSPTNFSPDYLMSHNVIFVTMNYRLHILGFLDLGLPECPGNVGFLDIVMAFEWVKENIASFGGDPNNVCAFGTSAGASAIHLLTMSPLTKDSKLFDKMILFSNNVLSMPLCKENPQENAFELGQTLGYRGRNCEALLKFLKDIPADEITEKVHDFYLKLKAERKGDVFCFPFLPTIQSVPKGAVMPADPRELIKTAPKYPTLTGMMNKEGLLAYYFEPFLMNFLIEDLGTVLQRNVPMSEDALSEVVSLVKAHYFQHKDLDYNAFPESINLFTDLYWLRRFYDGVRLLIENDENPVYVFEFAYDGALNCYKKYYPVLTRWIEGATHDDMLGYCLPFKADLGSKFSNKKDIQVINNVCTFLCNFVKTGNPNGGPIKTTWRRCTVSEPCYLQITDMLRMCKGKINESRVTLWENINKVIAENEGDATK